MLGFAHVWMNISYCFLSCPSAVSSAVARSPFHSRVLLHHSTQHSPSFHPLISFHLQSTKNLHNPSWEYNAAGVLTENYLKLIFPTLTLPLPRAFTSHSACPAIHSRNPASLAPIQALAAWHWKYSNACHYTDGLEQTQPTYQAPLDLPHH